MTHQIAAGSLCRGGSARRLACSLISPARPIPIVLAVCPPVFRQGWFILLDAPTEIYVLILLQYRRLSIPLFSFILSEESLIRLISKEYECEYPKDWGHVEQ